jgi:type II secretion system protein N
MKLKAPLRPVLYLLFVVTLVGVFVLVRFPYNLLERTVTALVAEHWNLRLDLENIHPTLTARLEFSGCSLQKYDGSGPAIFAMGQGYLRPRILPILTGQLGFSLRAKAYGGFLDGHFRLEPLFNAQKYYLDLNWQEVRLEEYPDTPFFGRNQASGKISGEVRFEGVLNEWIRSSGAGRLELREGSFQVDSPYLRVRRLEGCAATATLKLAGGKVALDDCLFSGQGINGNLSGEVILQPKITRSTLHLAGKCELDGEMLKSNSKIKGIAEALFKRNKPLPFKVEGTLAKPSIRIF